MKRAIVLLLVLMLLCTGCAGTAIPPQEAEDESENAVTLTALDTLYFMDGDDNNIENDCLTLSEAEQQELVAMLRPDEWVPFSAEEIPQYDALTVLTALSPADGGNQSGIVISCNDTGLLAKLENGEGSKTYRMPQDCRQPLLDWTAEKEAAWKKWRVLAMMQNLTIASHEIENGMARIVGPITPEQREELFALLQTERWTVIEPGSIPATEFRVLVFLSGDAPGEFMYVGVEQDGSAIIKAVWSQQMMTTLYRAPQEIVQPVEEFAATLTGERRTFD
jgi:hypothetical protein